MSNYSSFLTHHNKRLSNNLRESAQKILETNSTDVSGVGDGLQKDVDYYIYTFETPYYVKKKADLLTEYILAYYVAFKKTLDYSISLFNNPFEFRQSYSIVHYNYFNDLTNKASMYSSELCDLLLNSIDSQYRYSIWMLVAQMAPKAFFVFWYIFILVIMVMSYNRLFKSMMTCQLDDIEEVLASLNKLTNLLHEYKRDNYFIIDNISESDVYIHDRSEKKFTRPTIYKVKKISYFGMVQTFGILVVCNIIFVFNISMNLLIYIKCGKLVTKFNTGYIDVIQTVDLQYNIQTMHLKYLLYGPDYPVPDIGNKISLPTVDMNRKLNQSISKMLAISDWRYEEYADLDEYTNELIFGDICMKLEGGKNNSEACFILDSKVASEGLIQMFFRIMSRITLIQSKIDTMVSKGYSKSAAVDILNSPDYIEHEFMSDYIYSWIYRYMYLNLDKQINILNGFCEAQNDIWHVINQTWAIISGLHFLGSALYFYLFRLQALFIFHILPIRSVLDGSVLFKEFLNSYKLPRNYFAVD